VAQRFTAAINALFSMLALAAEGATRRAIELKAIYETRRKQIQFEKRSQPWPQHPTFRCPNQ
jgi:cytochrome c-type biogenesis protein CcmH/NrfG